MQRLGLLLAAMWWLGAGWALGARAQDAGEGAEPCDPARFICIEVYEDDPEAITARWDGAAGEWIAEPPSGYVEIRRQGDIVTARRMRLRESEQYARLEGDVLVVREDARIRSNTLDLWWEREEFIFTGDVELTQFEKEETAAAGEAGRALEGSVEGEQAPDPGGPRRPARTLWAQYVEYNGETGDVLARDRVHMVDDQYKVWADEAVYRDEAEEMTFTGDVRVVSLDPEWTMTGRHFFYDLASDQGRLIGPHRIEVTPKD